MWFGENYFREGNFSGRNETLNENWPVVGKSGEEMGLSPEATSGATRWYWPHAPLGDPFRCHRRQPKPDKKYRCLSVWAAMWKMPAMDDQVAELWSRPWLNSWTGRQSRSCGAGGPAAFRG